MRVLLPLVLALVGAALAPAAANTPSNANPKKTKPQPIQPDQLSASSQGTHACADE